MNAEQKKIFLNTLFWGAVFWVFGYVLGIVLFMFVPKDMIGWYILPFGVALMLWALLKKIVRQQFGCYFGLGLIWTVMAVALDYIFIVKLFKSAGYYKPDVYVYYALTFALPLAIGWYKKSKGEVK